MALKPTIYKFTINLSDLARGYFQAHSIVLAQHPSESSERMMVRCLAFLLNASENLSFSSGLSKPEEPDIWEQSLDSKILQWIYIGETSFERMKKASRQCASVKIYSSNTKAKVWWQQVMASVERLSVTVFRFNWLEIHALASMMERTMEFSVTFSGNALYCALRQGDVEISYQRLKG